MKIHQEVAREVVFSSLVGGDTFRVAGDDYDVIWMKTKHIELDKEDGNGLNAVAISDGEITYFKDSETVIPVTVSLIVKE